ncbi:MAG: hypothetical protein ACON5N_19260 [Akkermansiaceae bacterium]
MSSDRQSIAPHVLRDLANGLQQQMFFWGQDVVRPERNLLVEQGFSRSPSRGLKGTSCYRREWQGGHVELYGSCAGWYGEERGFCVHSSQEAVCCLEIGRGHSRPWFVEIGSD